MRSVDDQEADGRLSIAEAGVCCYRVGEVFKDPDKSAWRKNVTRENFNLLMERLANGDSDGVWVYDLTRFSRKPIEGERLIEIAERGLIVLSTDTSYDLTSPEGKSQFRDGMNRAALESDRIQKRVSRGKRKKAMIRGKSNAAIRGFARPGLLTRPEELGDLREGQPRPAASADLLERERAAVNEVADLILGRTSMDACAALLNERGLTTITGRPWSGPALKQTLRAPALCGLLEYKGEIVPDKTLPGPHALSVEKWKDLQEFFDSRRRGAPAVFYLLSGITRCSLCGAPLYGRPEYSKPPYADGEVKRSYWCQPIKRQRLVAVGCGRVAIDWRFMDDAVEHAVIDKLSDRRNAVRLAAEAAEGEEKAQSLDDKISKRRALARQMAAKAGAGEMDEEDYESWLDGHTRLMRELRRQREELNIPKAQSVNPDLVRQVWTSGTLEERRGLVQEAFPRLTLRPATRGKWGSRLARIDWHGESLPDA